LYCLHLGSTPCSVDEYVQCCFLSTHHPYCMVHWCVLVHSGPPWVMDGGRKHFSIGILSDLDNHAQFLLLPHIFSQPFYPHLCVNNLHASSHLLAMYYISFLATRPICYGIAYHREISHKSIVGHSKLSHNKLLVDAALVASFWPTDSSSFLYIFPSGMNGIFSPYGLSAAVLST
jgi:hypothetical protein